MKGSKVELLYHGHKIKIVQEILLGKRLLFAIAAPHNLAKEIAREIVVRGGNANGGKPIVKDFIVLPDNVSCANGMYFISSNENNIPSSLLNMNKLYGQISSMAVGFTFNVRH